MSSRSSRPRRTPLALRLAAIVLVPASVSLGYAWDGVREHQDTVEAADRLQRQVRLEQQANAIAVPAYIEGLAQRGLSSVDALGISREVVLDLVAVDYDAVYQANRIEFDRALQELSAKFGDVVTADGATLAANLDEVAACLDEQRRATDALSGDADAVASCLDRLAALLAATIETQRAELDGFEYPAYLQESRQWSAAANDLKTSAADEAEMLFDRLIAPEPPDPAIILAASMHHDRIAGDLAAQLGGERGEALLRLVGDRPDYTSLSVGGADGATVATSPLVADLAQALISEIEYLRSLDRFAAEVYSETVASAQVAADDARWALRRTVVISGAALAGSMVVVLLVSSTVLRPIRRLRRRATALSAGQFGQPPLPLRGPAEIRLLSDTVNDVGDTLLLLDRQASALASGRFDDPALTESTPGSLGEAIRRSVRRLSETTAQLRAAEKRASAIVEHAAVGIWTVGPDGRVQSANTAAEVLLGQGESLQLGTRLKDTLGTLQGEALVAGPGGDEIALLVDHTDVDTPDGPLRTVIARDITERRRFERRLARQARRDDLTGLANRYAVLELLGRRMADGGRVYVLFVDIDGFKSVNDSLGHRAGDLVLAEVARRLMASAPPGALVSRLGGDEFVVVLADTDDSAVQLCARRLIESVEQPFDLEGYPFIVSACVGVGTTENLSDPLDAIHRADAAVYQAKLRGRGRVEVFDEELQVELEARADLELDLRNALGRGEMALHLQPVVDLRSLEVCGAEALLRWTRPGHGPVPPSEFIPVAERTGMIVAIDRWVLRSGCDLLARWSATPGHEHLRLAVNISGRHLMDGDLVADLSDAAVASAINSDRLEIEITESELIADMSRACVVLQQIREMGVTVAVDDFGTGFSSMSYLRQLPIDALKVDRSFVSRAGDDDFDSEVIRAMVSFGRVLGVSVVAEGVETDEQLRYVRAQGCDRAQGYLLGRPMPIEEFDQLLRGAVPAGAR